MPPFFEQIWPGSTALRVAFVVSVLVALLALFVQFLSLRTLRYLWIAIEQLGSDILLFAPDRVKKRLGRGEWLKGSFWDTRVERWRDHVKTYLNLKHTAERTRLSDLATLAAHEAAHEPEDPKKQEAARNAQHDLDTITDRWWGAERIHYLSSDRLAILTPKFSTVLTFQSLTLVAMSVTMGTFWKDADAALRRELWQMLAVLALPWSVTVMACLIANGNVYWGDMWRPTKGPVSESFDDLTQRENAYADLLIGVLILRSAILRVVTFVALVTFFLAVVVIVHVLRAAPLPEKPPTIDGPGGHSGPLPPDAQYVFASGESCTGATRAWAEKLAASVATTEGLTANISITADTRPLLPDLQQRHGSLIGFAHECARCLERLLKGAFEERRAKLHTTVVVRDITSKTMPAEIDRTAIVTWSRSDGH